MALAGRRLAHTSARIPPTPFALQRFLFFTDRCVWFR
jgi:hypothetical protein